MSDSPVDRDQKALDNDGHFLDLCLQQSLKATAFNRFWFFAAPHLAGGVLVPGSTGIFGVDKTGEGVELNYRNAVGDGFRLDRAAWADLIRVLVVELKLTRQEIEAAVAFADEQSELPADG